MMMMMMMTAMMMIVWFGSARFTFFTLYTVNAFPGGSSAAPQPSCPLPHVIARRQGRCVGVCVCVCVCLCLCPFAHVISRRQGECVSVFVFVSVCFCVCVLLLMSSL
jgi:hypothetical protein